MISSVEQDSESERWSEEALRNPLILRLIFSHFPTKFLLNSASLVNKTWNRAARTFIRDHQKCTAVSVKLNGDRSECDYLRELDDVCCEMTAEGRVIPFNTLKIPSSHCRGEYLDDPDFAENIKLRTSSGLKLKHLEIQWLTSWPVPDCPSHRPLQALLLNCASDLVTLKIQDMTSDCTIIFSDLVSGFPRLEEIVVQHKRCLVQDWPGVKRVLVSLLDSAPNLKRIIAEDLDSLRILPTEKYGLLHRTKFDVTYIKDENLFLKIAEGKPQLKELRISPPHSAITGTDSDCEDRGSDGSFPRQRFMRALENLLQACHQTLNTISTRAFLSFDELSFPPLVNLKKLRLKNLTPRQKRGGRPDGIWNAIISMDYDVKMPNLEEMEIIIRTVTRRTDISNGFVRCRYSSLVWPDFDLKTSRLTVNSCQSVRKLTLELQVRLIKWHIIQSVFPNVRVLEVRVSETTLLGRYPMPFSQMFQCWPDLEELKITGGRNYLVRNYDADFCGIFEAEAELLRENVDDEEFLRAVHIVPVRPSLLTMSNLRQVFIQLKFEGAAKSENVVVGGHQNPVNFISKVTPHVALKRIPDGDAVIIGVLKMKPKPETRNFDIKIPVWRPCC